MAVSDRIAVMNAGVIQHVGTPKDIYQRPANIFVSTFIGRSNVLDAELKKKADGMYLSYGAYEAKVENIIEQYQKDSKIKLSVRPEELLINENGEPGIEAIVDDCVFLGLNTHCYMHLADGTEVECIEESKLGQSYEPGTKLSLSINTVKVNMFTEDGEKNIIKGVHNQEVIK